MLTVVLMSILAWLLVGIAVGLPIALLLLAMTKPQKEQPDNE